MRETKAYFREGTKAVDAFEQIEPIINRLGGWDVVYQEQDGELLGADEALAYFCHLWARVRIPPGADPLDVALNRALAMPYRTARSDRHSQPKYDRFVSLALWLQTVVGDGPIMLPCRKVAALLDSTKDMVAVWRQMAIADGYLVVEQAHEFSRHARRATRFRVPAKWLSALEQRRTAQQA